MAVGDAHVFPCFQSHRLLFSHASAGARGKNTPERKFSQPGIELTCFSRGERRKYAGKKVRLNRVSNSQSPGHESDTLTTEPTRRGQNQSSNKSKYARPLQIRCLVY